MKTKEKATTKEKKVRRRFAVQDEPRLYFILQIVFSIAQILLAYKAIGEENLAPGGMAIFALFGIALLLMAAKGWQSKGIRILGRGLAAVVVLGFTAILLLDVFTTQITNPLGTGYITRTFGDYMGQLGAYLCLYIQALTLFLFPTFAIAARRVKKKADIWLLRISSWLMVAFAAITLLLSNETQTRLDFTAGLMGLVSNDILLLVYLFCTVASVFAVFMLYPYGVKRIKRLVEAARAKRQEKA